MIMKKCFHYFYSKKYSHFKNLIMAWAKNEKFELNVEDVSTDVVSIALKYLI